MYKLSTKGFYSSWSSLVYFHLLLPSLPPPDEKVTDVGALEADKEFVREDPLSLPDKFSWDDINLSDSAQVPAFICTDYRPLSLLYFSLFLVPSSLSPPPLLSLPVSPFPFLLPLLYPPSSPSIPLSSLLPSPPFPQLDELYVLLSENYVEDDDNMFRFDYGREFIHWALQPPDWRQSWHCGIRATTSGKLVGFISAVPAHIRVKEQ